MCIRDRLCVGEFCYRCFISHGRPTREVCGLIHMKKFAITVLSFWLIAVMLGRLFGLNPNSIDLNAILSTPSAAYWLGADDLGRSILARLLRGVEVSFVVATVVTVVTMTIGVLVGLIAGFYGGKIDQFLMKITDIFLAFPGILLAIAFAAVLGPGLVNLTIALSMTAVSYTHLLLIVRCTNLINTAILQCGEVLKKCFANASLRCA